MNKMKRQALIAIALLATTGAALADSETYTFTIPNTEAGGINNSSFNLTGFDPGMGTLTGVTLGYDLTTSSMPTIFAPSGGTYTGAHSTYTLTVAGPGLDEQIVTSSGPEDGTAGPGFTDAPATTETTSGSVAVAAAQFSSYESGPVTFTLNSTALTSGGSPGPGTLGIGGDGYYSGPISVTYAFTATPEPRSWAMLGLSLGLLGIWNFRIRRLRP